MVLGKAVQVVAKLVIQQGMKMSIIAIVLPMLMYGCGGGGGGITTAVPPDGRDTGPVAVQRSVKIHNYNNWEFPNDSTANMESMLKVLARRDNICISEPYEHANAFNGWSKISPQSIKAYNPAAKVYRLYSIMCKPAWDSDWNTPSDLRRMQCPLTKADINAHDWWLRDGNGNIAKENDQQWFLDVGKPGFKEAFLSAVLTRNAGKGFDGFVFDYVPMKLVGEGQGWGAYEDFFSHNPLPPNYTSDADYLEKAVKPFIEYVWNGLHASGYRIIGNCIGEFGTPAASEQFVRSKSDGAIYELGTIAAGGGWETPYTVASRMQAIRNDTLEVWVGEGQLRKNAPDYDAKQRVSLAYYYIAIPPTQQNRSYHSAYDGNPHWQAIWDFYIGEPTGEAVKRDGLYFWSRYYTRGLVLLNYESSEKVSFVLDRQYIDSSGKVVSGTVKVSPHDALILAVK